MERAVWLRKLQRECEAKYDGYAPLYWEKYGLYSNVTHRQFLEKLLSLLPAKSNVLDAACGAGRYESFLLDKGYRVTGVDQSAGMLARAGQKFAQVRYVKMGVQQIAYRETFDGVICIDAMENIPPEDWPVVMANFYRALKPGGYLYFTAETIENADEDEMRQAYEQAKQAGLPVVYGERLDEEVYHYHPSNEQVRSWVRQSGFEIIEEANGEIWYYHILVRKVA
jgi:ubiquinone/menaquinone biosynthesis C-methylase UbiE